MQFINIVVHSVEDMNFRVHLQYEFTKLGLEEFLQVSWAGVLTVGGASGQFRTEDQLSCITVGVSFLRA